MYHYPLVKIEENFSLLYVILHEQKKWHSAEEKEKKVVGDGEGWEVVNNAMYKNFLSYN